MGLVFIMSAAGSECRSGGFITARSLTNSSARTSSCSFDWRDELDVEWAGHPNWYFRISKFSIPYLKHASVPKTWFLDKLEEIPPDLENYALKPLYSFAGLGVVIAPTKEDIAAIPAEKRPYYILQERMHFEPVIETPFGGTKAEVRVMYVWLDELTPVMTIIRMGRGSDDGRGSQQEYGVGGSVSRAVSGRVTVTSARTAVKSGKLGHLAGTASRRRFSRIPPATRETINPANSSIHPQYCMGWRSARTKWRPYRSATSAMAE